MTTLDLHHLAAAYALDALDLEERRAFEAHYPSCDVCVQEVENFRGISAQLGQALASPPPAHLKTSVMQEIAETRQISPLVASRAVDLTSGRRLRVALSLALTAAAAAVLVVFGLLATSRFSSTTSATEQVLGAPDAVVTSLDGETGSLRVVWSDELDQVAIFGNALATTGEAMTYELWFVEDDGVTRAALFAPESDGSVRSVLDIDDINPIGWGVTIEPAGGSDQPTGEILYLGTF